MKKITTTLSTLAIASLIAPAAFAHAGSHDSGFMANLVHWLTSPTHAMLAIIGGFTLLALAYKRQQDRS